MPPHACAEIRKKKNVYAAIATTAATIQQNMYKYANTRKMSRIGKYLGNAETETDVVDARRRTENCVCGYKKT